MKMKNIQGLCEVVMLQKPRTRDDDSQLYASICAMLNPLCNTLDMTTILNNRERFGLPSFESVSRARRKVQRENPSLRPSEHATAKRYEHWKEVRKWAQEGDLENTTTAR